MCALVGREVLSTGKVPIDKCTLSSFGALCTVGKSFTITVFYHELKLEAMVVRQQRYDIFYENSIFLLYLCLV